MMNKPKRIIALLPMKANSTRVKGKNFRDLCGKPLFRWTLDALLAVDDIDQVVINTDARHILAENNLAETDRILIRDRNPDICGDHVSMNLIIQDDIRNVSSDVYLMTHTTNPLISSQTIRKALSMFLDAQESGSCDSLFSVNRFQSRFYSASGMAINHDPANLIPTQDLDPWFEENSCLYIFSQQSFDSTNARIGLRPLLFETQPLESVDIDTPQDWQLAEALASSKLLNT